MGLLKMGYNKLLSFMFSKNTIPGSPVFHTFLIIFCIIPCSLLFSPAKNLVKKELGVHMLILWLCKVLLSLRLMNFSISGWSMLRIPIEAPLLFPPWATLPVVSSVPLSQDSVPEDLPPVLDTNAPSG